MMMGIQTDLYQEQHDQITRLLAQLNELLDIHTLQTNADYLSSLISSLIERLSVHLALEDNVLYQHLAESPNVKLNELGKSFQDQIGGLRKTLNAYKDMWSTSLSIQESPEQFVRETEAFMGVVKKRIQLEDEDLFSIIDR
jgi:hemerythrin-like domain-containing protein